MTHSLTPLDYNELAQKIKSWSKELGFADTGITGTDLSEFEDGYFNWLEQNFHGEMHYMQAHGSKRTRPEELVPGTIRIISLRMNYFDADAKNAAQQLHQPTQAYISRYALGRDYHKLIRQRLKQLVSLIQQHYPHAAQRIFVDSAPVLERPIAQQAGLGFIGKNSLIIHPRAGSWFFLAEIYTDLPLPIDQPFSKQGCGPCTACIEECPTQAILPNGIVDARRCISYLTIEFDGVIPIEFRSAIGNRIYGCDDCQLVCPWNHFTHPQQQADFKSRNSLDQIGLDELFTWSEEEFNQRMEGSPIRRIGYTRWIRNLVIALGNAPYTRERVALLVNKHGQINALIDEHIDWALSEQHKKSNLKPNEVTNPSAIKPFVAKKYYLLKQSIKPV